ncbi:unnamed protein product [Rotaria sordida]|uniref:Uncharacterized protein n=1 Tax=Rotaria sordida TaxID=392033 RepID=A0A819PMG1_9BILA|nr:unnamed protein product [Rotaria sordida]
MLSQKEYDDTLWKYNNISKSITGQTRKNIRQTYREKLIEHYYALNYPPFEPSSYELIFINYRTLEETLIQLIKIINSSTLFIMDTESVCAYKKPNKPVLIQTTDKRHTRSPFDIGLDPKLVKLNSNEFEYRQLITQYAANDCDAMYQLLITMDVIKQQSSQSPANEEETNNDLELMLFDVNEQNEQELFEEQQTTITSSSTTKATHFGLPIPSSNDNESIE